MERPKLIEKLAIYFSDSGLEGTANTLLTEICDSQVIKDDWIVESGFVESLGATLNELPPPNSHSMPTPPRIICHRVLSECDLEQPEDGLNGFILDEDVKLKLYELSYITTGEEVLRTVIQIPQQQIEPCSTGGYGYIELSKLESDQMVIHSRGWNKCVKKLSLQEGSKIMILEYPNGSLILLKEENLDGQKKGKQEKRKQEKKKQERQQESQSDPIKNQDRQKKRKQGSPHESQSDPKKLRM